jgi:hypothetical protein
LTYVAFYLLIQLPLVAEEYSIGPAPDWVTDVKADTRAHEPDDVSEGIYYLLLDNQTYINTVTVQYYVHYALKLINKTGVEENSQIAITFDPSYEYITLHKILLHRGAQQLNRLDKKKIEVLQREKDLDYLVYDGSKELSLILEDVQIGDTLEVCYTKKGYNPVFKNTFAGAFQMQWSMPVKHIYKRLKKEKVSVLNLKYFNYQQNNKDRYD